SQDESAARSASQMPGVLYGPDVYRTRPKEDPGSNASAGGTASHWNTTSPAQSLPGRPVGEDAFQPVQFGEVLENPFPSPPPRPKSPSLSSDTDPAGARLGQSSGGNAAGGEGAAPPSAGGSTADAGSSARSGALGDALPEIGPSLAGASSLTTAAP